MKKEIKVKKKIKVKKRRYKMMTIKNLMLKIKRKPRKMRKLKKKMKIQSRFKLCLKKMVNENKEDSQKDRNRKTME